MIITMTKDERRKDFIRQIETIGVSLIRGAENIVKVEGDKGDLAEIHISVTIRPNKLTPMLEVKKAYTRCEDNHE